MILQPLQIRQVETRTGVYFARDESPDHLWNPLAPSSSATPQPPAATAAVAPAVAAQQSTLPVIALAIGVAGAAAAIGAWSIFSDV